MNSNQNLPQYSAGDQILARADMPAPFCWHELLWLLESRAGTAVAIAGSIMLKITTLRELNGIRFLVEGKLASATIGVLEDCWREARRMRFPEIHVEFLDITYVDARGKELLKQMAMAGVNFSAKGVQMKSIVQEILEEAL